MSRVTVSASGKGGVGKSTVAVHIGRILAARGKRVLLIDADVGLRSIDMMLGITDAVAYDLGDVLKARCTPAQALCRVPDAGDLFAVAAPQLCEESGSPGGLRKLLHGYARYFDVVLVDCPAGLDEGFRKVADAADDALVVCTPDMLCARDAQLVGEHFRSRGIPARLIINRLRTEPVRRGVLPDIDEIIDAAGLQLIGVIPDDEVLAQANADGTAPREDSRALYCLENIAARYMGEEVPLAPLEKW